MDANNRQLKDQVFVNFRGDELRCGFVSHLVEALQRNGVNVFIDKHERIGEDLTNLLVRIEESAIALVIFSTRYTESRWCLDELVKIKERTDQGLLKVIPIFYKVEPDTVTQLREAFGDQFRVREWEYRCDKPRTDRWKEAVTSVSCKIGLTCDKKSDESKFVRIIVKEVKKMLHGNIGDFPFSEHTSSVGGQRSSQVSPQEPVDLYRESFALVKENANIANQIAAISIRYTDIECENRVLKAQHGELSQRLESLNSIIQTVEGVVIKIPEVPDFLMNPWQLPCLSQPIMAPADMFQY